MTLKNELLKEPRQRRYTARDFNSLRAQLVKYARQYYPNNIQDFSENGLGGLLVDLAAYVGDSMSFYLDHQFNELFAETAVEDKNIERHLRSSGVKIIGSSPANVKVSFYVQIPAETKNSNIIPQQTALPIIHAGSRFSADNGTVFNLLNDVDFRSVDSDGNLVATQKIGRVSATGDILTFILIMSGDCVSGEEATDTFTINDTFVPFRKLTLTNPNVSQILSVNDSYGNQYYEVSALTDDIVYVNIPNVRDDKQDVPDNIKILPAPYRFTSEVTLSSRKTVLTFGGGSAATLDDDIIPDPSEFAVNFVNRRVFSRTAINPNNLLSTKTLGVATTNTELTVHYRFGGGLSHNVSQNEIRSIETLNMSFPGNPGNIIASQIRRSVEVTNDSKASDGEDAPTVEELRLLIPSHKAAQERIASRQDLLARVATMPSNFGRAYRTAVHTNPNNLSTQLFIVSRDADGYMTTSSDSLKLNIVKFLNPYRMINDVIEILDSAIVNFQVSFDVVVDPVLNKSTVLQQILLRLKQFFRIQNFYIDQPIILSEVRNNIMAIRGVISINSLNVTNVYNLYNNRSYSNVIYDVDANTIKDIIHPPDGGIFELKYPDVDIIGKTA